MTSSDHFAKSPWMLTVTSLAVVVAVLYFAKGVLVPLTLAVLLSFLLVPVCDWLERRKLGRIPSVLITVIVAFSALGAGAWTAALQVMDLAPKIPEYQSNIRTKLHSVNDYLGAALGKVRGTAEDIGEVVPASATLEGPGHHEERPSLVRVVPAPQSPLEIIGSMFGSMLVLMGTAGIVSVLVVFFLIRREDLRDRFIRLVGRGHVTLTTQALEDATARVSRYLLMQLLINITFGVPVAIGLYFIGVPNAVLWGILATVLRFIPYIGAWSAAAAPIGLSLAMSADWIGPLLTIGLFVVLELFVNNVMEPWLYGKNTGISAVALLVAAVFWTWLWGAMGLLLATPLTVCLLVIGRHVAQLSFLDTLLGNEPVFELKKRVYQRLLAGDQEEATELLLDELEKRPLVEVYDTVLIPALAMAETHWHRGEFDENRRRFILNSLRTSVEELGERQQATQAKLDAAAAKDSARAPILDPLPDTSQLCVLCLPAHDEADEIAGQMLAQLLGVRGYSTHVATVAALVSERVALVEERAPDVVCVSATPPAAAMHARHLCRRIRGRFPEANLIVGLWDAQGDLDKSKERIDCGAATHVVATLAGASDQIQQLIQLGRARARPAPQAPVPIEAEGVLA
jgi:predicted PurR-regulated permease PerM/CheY-like chemotaxis protein